MSLSAAAFTSFLPYLSSWLIVGRTRDVLFGCFFSSMLFDFDDLEDSDVGEGLLSSLRKLFRIGSFEEKLVSYDLAFGVGTSSFFP